MIRPTLGSHLPPASFCLCLSLLAILSCATRNASLQAGLPIALSHEQQAGPANPKAQRPNSPHDQPDAAWEYYMAKRSAAGGTGVDIVREYRRALDRMERMPVYSTRSRRIRPSVREAGLKSGMPRRSASDLLSVWEFLGPGNIGGRTRAVQIHPDNPEILYAAGVSGGVWKTENGGKSWRPLADFLPNIAVNSLAMNPSNPQVLYAGTGEGYFREVVRGTGLPLRGEGILKTTDGGDTWLRLESTAGADFHWVNDLAVSVNDTNRVYAATRTGVWRSDDAGASWNRILDGTGVTGGCLHLAMRTDRATDYLLASCGTFEQASVYLGTEAERDPSWTQVLSEPGMGLTSMAFAPSDPDVVYALATSYVGGPDGRFNGGLHAVFRSDRGGAAGTWSATVRNTDPNKLNTLLLTNPLSASQQVCGIGSADNYSTLGWYTNVIAVDPRDPEIVFAGGIDLFRSDDGGRNWGPISHWGESPPSAHADQHVIVFHPGYDGDSNQAMFLGGDGGVWRTGNARAPRSTAVNAPCTRSSTQVRWESLNHNYGVTQFYFGMPFPDGKSYLGGTQDNGTLMGSESGGADGWRHILGGDGGYVAVDPANPQIVYAESQYLNLRRSTDGGRTFVSATAGITESRSNFLFVSPFVMDPGSPERLWAGGQHVWRTSDGAVSWQQASARLTTEGRVSAIAASPGDSDRVLVGLSNGFIHRQDRATAATASTVWPASRPREGFVTSLAFDPSDPEVAYATYAEFGGRHVWRSGDGGVTWNALDGDGDAGLPDIPVHALVVDPGDRQRLYIGTDLGVFTSPQGGNTWAVENTGFANTVTESLYLQARPGTTPMLWAFTHGRGAWRVPLASAPDPPGCNPQRWIAHVTPAGVPYETTILATNSGAAESQVELVPYREGGSRFDSVFLRVPPGATYAAPSRRTFSDQPVSHFGVCGPESVSVAAAYKSTEATGASAYVPADRRQAGEFLLYPGDWDVVWDGMAIINMGSEPSRVEASLVDSGGRELRRAVLNAALAPRAKQVAVLDNALSGARGAAIRIVSSQPATLLLLRGTHSGRSPVLLYPTEPVGGEGTDDTPGACEPKRWILHVTPRDSGYETHVLATNLGTSEEMISLIPFLEDGTRLNPVARRLAAGGTDTRPAQDLFAGAEVAGFGICGPARVTVSAAYRPAQGPAASAHVPAISATAASFLTYPGEWDVVFDGLAVVNRGGQAAGVEAVLMDGRGAELRRVKLAEALPPGARRIALLDGIFAGLQGAAIRIESTQPSSVLLLRGTKAGVQPSVLFQAIPITFKP